MKQPQLKAYVIVRGIKKRCRNSERHMITIGNFPLNADRETLRTMAKNRVVADMRTVEPGGYLCLDYVEVEQSEWGQTETWMPFDKRHVRIDLATGEARS